MRQLQPGLELSPRYIGPIFRVGLLKSVLTGRDGDAMRAYREFASVLGDVGSNGEIVRAALGRLQDDYRNEYFYKNLLANRLLLAPTQSHSSALLMELRFASSIVDAVLIGDEPVAYEIKTELDSPSKLLGQLDSYKRVVSKVVLVTHSSLLERYEPMLPAEVGLMALRSSGALATVRRPTADSTRLDIESIFKTLRQEEYVRIVWRWTGKRPVVPGALLYEHCLSVVSEMPIELVVAEHTRELRTRGLRFAKEVRDERLRDIRSLCVQLNPSRDQITRILQWLGDRPDVHSILEGQTV